jgi:hypothetical protein
MKLFRIFVSVLFALVFIMISPGSALAQTTTDGEPMCPTTADWGDLPNSYGTLYSSGGAYHLTTGLKLGSLIGIDPDGIPTADAQGDDTNGGGDDEDGIAPIGLWSAGLVSAGKGGSVRVTVSGCTGTCYLSAFIDWNQNGSWNLPRERIIDNAPVVNGTQIISFNIPTNTPYITFLNKTYNTRFRLVSASTPTMSPTGGQPSGEVEDYKWVFGPTAVDLREIKATSSTGSGWLFPLAGVLGLCGLGWLSLRRRK